jgi:hypothetical protein
MIGAHEPATRWANGIREKRDMRVAIVRVVEGAAVLGLAWGCAPHSEHESYQRADRLNQARERFVAKKDQCEHHGGNMVLRSQRSQEPSYYDYRLAECEKH